VERTEKVVDINHYGAAVRDPEVQSCVVLALLKSQSFEQVLNKVVDSLLLVACLSFVES